MDPITAPSGIEGCHLVGSVPYHNSETVFRECVARLPGRLRRLPDGETGKRTFFTYWQFAVFDGVPQCISPFVMNRAAEKKEFTSAEVQDNIALLRGLENEIRTGYDDEAIKSYAVFKRLKDEGVIPENVRFQVSLPTAVNVVVALHHQYRETGFKVYEAALFRAMRRIQDNIPHDDLSIQIDLAVDTAFWEGAYEKPWFDNPREETLNYILRMISQVDEGVELGLHNCYGDMEHKHWMEPTSLQSVTDRALALLARTLHRISYFHCPVPLSAMPFLTAYFAPLKVLYPALVEHRCELVLGLVHFQDLQGTRERIEEARKVAPRFGVATECGMGRTPLDQLADLMVISASVAGPVDDHIRS